MTTKVSTKMVTAAKREGTVWAAALGLFLAYMAWDAYWSPNHWYRLDRVYVENGIVGQPIRIAVDREIIRPFKGEYVVTIRRLPQFEAICSGGSAVNYRPGSTLPERLTMEWWSYGAQPPCGSVLVAGKYEMETCVTVEPEGLLLGPRTTCTRSNVFQMAEAGQ